MTSIEWLLVIACVILALLPPKYDPAIRLKEWNDRRDKKG